MTHMSMEIKWCCFARGNFMTTMQHTARLAKTPARAVRGCPGSCGGPFCVFSTDLEPPGQGAPARLGPLFRDARESAVSSFCVQPTSSFWPSQRCGGRVVIVDPNCKKEGAIPVLEPLGLESEG